MPVLVTDDGEVIADSHRIIEWAEANPEHRSAVAGSAIGGAVAHPGSIVARPKCLEVVCIRQANAVVSRAIDSR